MYAVLCNRGTTGDNSSNCGVSVLAATKLNDNAEPAAIKKLFGRRTYHMPVSSTKSMHSRLLGAAGVHKAMNAGLLSPPINYEGSYRNWDLDHVPNEAPSAELHWATSNGVGQGGHNATLILRKTTPDHPVLPQSEHGYSSTSQLSSHGPGRCSRPATCRTTLSNSRGALPSGNASTTSVLTIRSCPSPQGSPP